MSLSDERDIAEKCGLKRFHSDTPCRKCGGEIRHTGRDARCAQCAKDNQVKIIVKSMENA